MKEQQEFLNRLTKLYKGFEIEVRAIALRGEAKLFTAHLTIRKDARSYVDDTIFQTGQTFSSANAALEAGIEIGRKKIDEGFAPTNVVVNK